MVKKNTKIFLLSILMLTIVIFFWWQLSIFFKRNFTFKTFIYFLIDFLAVVILVLIFNLLIDNRKFAYISFLISAFSFFFFFPLNYLYLISQILLFLLFILSFEFIHQDLKNQLKISLRKTFSRGLAYLITGIVLSVSIIYYRNPILLLDQNEIFVSPYLVSILTKPIGFLIGGIIPNYSLDMTIDEFTLKTLESRNQFKGFKFPKVLKEEILKKQRKALSETLGMEIKGNETINVLLSKIINKFLRKYIRTYKKQINITIAVGLFLLLRLLGVIIGFFAIILSQIIFLILKRIKFLTIKKVFKEGEIIKI